MLLPQQVSRFICPALCRGEVISGHLRLEMPHATKMPQNEILLGPFNVPILLQFSSWGKDILSSRWPKAVTWGYLIFSFFLSACSLVDFSS